MTKFSLEEKEQEQPVSLPRYEVIFQQYIFYES